MQRIQFSACEPFLTGDDLADALLDYAWALAQYRRHDLVRVPAVLPDGTATEMTLLVGPGAQLSASRVPAAAGVEDVRDVGVEAGIRARAALLRGAVTAPFFDLEDEVAAFD